MIFSPDDIKQLKKQGQTVEKIERQLQFYHQNTPFAHLLGPATAGNGIQQLSEAEKERSAAFFDAHKSHFKMVKFVPASGAATRMFKSIASFLERFRPGEQTLKAYINAHKAKELKTFLVGMDKLPFFKKIDRYLNENIKDFKSLTPDEKNLLFIKTMYATPPFGYSQKPKGLIPFHRYKNKLETAFEAHLHEAAGFLANGQKTVLHFTVSENHLPAFRQLLEKKLPKLTAKYHLDFEVGFSFQKKSTDTLAVNMNNLPVRDHSGQLVFRPGGHGALIENLNDLDADFIFIKNIDNVVRKQMRAQHSHHKKILGGWALQLQSQIFDFMEAMDKGRASIEEIEEFLKQKLNRVFPEHYPSFSPTEKEKYCRDLLNRPLRVCGMVLNEGEPGGGPFWVQNDREEVSLQIVESAQVNREDPLQENLRKQATHFNPVDLVCAVKDYKGQSFDLRQFVDEQAVFIAQKSYEGKEIKALELPGLWNGAMANWNTVFIEMPIETFNPVKTINDLLKPTHLG